MTYRSGYNPQYNNLVNAHGNMGMTPRMGMGMGNGHQYNNPMMHQQSMQRPQAPQMPPELAQLFERVRVLEATVNEQTQHINHLNSQLTRLGNTHSQNTNGVQTRYTQPSSSTGYRGSMDNDNDSDVYGNTSQQSYRPQSSSVQQPSTSPKQDLDVEKLDEVINESKGFELTPGSGELLDHMKDIDKHIPTKNGKGINLDVNDDILNTDWDFNDIFIPEDSDKKFVKSKVNITNDSVTLDKDIYLKNLDVPSEALPSVAKRIARTTKCKDTLDFLTIFDRTITTRVNDYLLVNGLNISLNSYINEYSEFKSAAKDALATISNIDDLFIDIDSMIDREVREVYNKVVKELGEDEKELPISSQCDLVYTNYTACDLGLKPHGGDGEWNKIENLHAPNNALAVVMKNEIDKSSSSELYLMTQDRYAFKFMVAGNGDVYVRNFKSFS